MGSKTAIGWTDATWNPVSGCSKVSPGCDNCYAEALSHRFGWTQKPWTAPHAAQNVVLHPDRLSQPLRWQKPRHIFVNSMSDLFHQEVPDSFLDEVFAVMAMAPRHTFQILTKRPQRMHDYLTDPETSRRIASVVLHQHATCEKDGVMSIELYNHAYWPLPNVWLGVSVEDQRRAIERVPILMEIPAVVRFLSCEPLLGPINIDDAMYGARTYGPMDWFGQTDGFGHEAFIHWVIVGAESGPNARPMDDDWVRSLRDQCVAANVPFFFKQRAHKGHKEIDPLLYGILWQQLPVRRSP